jgi:hypothetical protein
MKERAPTPLFSNPGEPERLSGRERMIGHIRPSKKGDGMDDVLRRKPQKFA